MLCDIQKLIDECNEIIMQATSSGTRSIHIHPKMGYTAKNPEAFKRDFWEALKSFDLSKSFSSGVNMGLVKLANDTSSLDLMKILIHCLTGSGYEEVFSNFLTINSMIAFCVFEGILRRLSTNIIDSNTDKLVRDCQIRHENKTLKKGSIVSTLKYVLYVFEAETPYKELASDFKRLDDNRQLYDRLTDSRNWLFHGNVIRSEEGILVVLLIDLMILHVVKQDKP